MTKLYIIIPARNEEGIIERTLKELNSKVKSPHNIIVVNDASTDSTVKVVKKYAKDHNNVSVVSTPKGKNGFANALSFGFKMVPEESFVVPVMADLCDDTRSIDRMYKKMRNTKADVVCGSRYMKGGKKIGGPILQGLFSVLVGKSLYYITGVPTKDVSNAFKMYKKNILKQVKVDPKSGFEVSMEITLQLYFSGAKIEEVPTTWKGRTVGKSKFKLLKRAPRYWKIYKWAVENGTRRILRKKFLSYTISND